MPSTHARVNRWIVPLVAVTSAALIGSVLIGGFPDPYAQDVAEQFRGPSEAHWLGTDQLGRDLTSRIFFALLNSAKLIGICLLVTLALAFPLGMLAARKRNAETPLEIIAGAIWSLPTFVIGLMVFVGLRGESIALKFAFLGFFNWVPIYRSVRDMTRQVQALPFVTFARAMGNRESKIYLFHVLPNVVQAVFPIIVLNVVSLLEAEFLLSFLGLSYPEPAPTLGGILRQGISYLSVPMMMVSSALMGALIFGLLVSFEPRLRSQE